MYVAIEGVIGVGKTTLARILAERDASVLEYLSAFARFSSFRRGVVDTRSLFYCLSLSSLALFIAANAVGLRRLR